MIVFLRHFVFIKQVQPLVVFKFYWDMYRSFQSQCQCCRNPPSHLAVQDFFLPILRIYWVNWKKLEVSKNYYDCNSWEPIHRSLLTILRVLTPLLHVIRNGLSGHKYSLWEHYPVFLLFSVSFLPKVLLYSAYLVIKVTLNETFLSRGIKSSVRFPSHQWVPIHILNRGGELGWCQCL